MTGASTRLELALLWSRSFAACFPRPPWIQHFPALQTHSCLKIQYINLVRVASPESFHRVFARETRRLLGFLARSPSPQSFYYLLGILFFRETNMAAQTNVFCLLYLVCYIAVCTTPGPYYNSNVVSCLTCLAPLATINVRPSPRPVQ